MEEKLNELLKLQQENNAMLKEILAILKNMQDPNNIMEENTNDFIMNVLANLVASTIERK